MNKVNNYQESNFNSHKKLLEAFLNLIIARKEDNSNLIYRGVGDEKLHKLIPTALRIKGEERMKSICSGILTDEDFTKPKPYSWAEMITFSLFYQQANLQGLPLPIVSTSAHQALLQAPNDFITSGVQLKLEEGGGWPNKEILPILALAQHYGVPTSLLDWTTDPYVALYFAALSSLEMKGNENGMAIWILDRKSINRIYNGRYKGQYTSLPKYNFEFVELPHFQNPNLSAQKGVFSIVKMNQEWMNEKERQDSKVEYIDRISLDEALWESGKCINWNFPNLKREQKELKILTKITLQKSEIPSLLRALRNLGYHGSSIFPGYQGCEKSLKELELIKKFESR